MIAIHQLQGLLSINMQRQPPWPLQLTGKGVITGKTLHTLCLSVVHVYTEISGIWLQTMQISRNQGEREYETRRTVTWEYDALTLNGFTSVYDAVNALFTYRTGQI